MSTGQKDADRRAVLKEAVRALDDMRGRLEASERRFREPIAIIGIGCRFPGATGPEAFWRLLRDGVRAIREVPAGRWDPETCVGPQLKDTVAPCARWGGFLDEIDAFDPVLFGISPREASSMDPQHRVYLEVAIEALEHAGVPFDRLEGSLTGVYTGIITNDYGRLASVQARQYLEKVGIHFLTGNSLNSVSGRVSFLLGLHGPSMAVDTACSSSLVALHLACQGLRMRECDLAVAGGVNAMLAPEVTIGMAAAGALAPDGRTKAFDARADGFVRSEGCGALVLRRLDDAVAAGDRIIAVIRGSVVNQDGASSGLTAPSGPAQEALIREGLARAGVGPEELGLVEAHGTGTSLGDSIELQALAAVLGRRRGPSDRLAIGSVKTNVGHLEASAGVCGVIKVALAIQAGEIPASLELEEPSPHIDWNEAGLFVPTETMPWSPANGSRTASVSSFGLSGTNAFMVLEQAPEAEQQWQDPPERPVVVPISTRGEGALRELCLEYARALDSNTELHPYDVARSASLSRSHLEDRLTIAAADRDALKAGLEECARGAAPEGVARFHCDPACPPEIVFVFPGQGSQWPGMCRQLYASSEVFRSSITTCAEAMRAFVDWDPLAAFAGTGEPDVLTDIDVIQPSLFAIQVSLAALLRSWGVEPVAVIGHSMGEVAAAHVAGVLTLEDAARIICRRSRLLRRVAGQGAMAVVGLPMEQTHEALAAVSDKVAVAIANSPRSTVISGDPEAIGTLLEGFQERNVFCRAIKVDVASHSPQMDPLRADILEALQGIEPGVGMLDMYSTVEGRLEHGRELEPGYWMRNLREPVRFADAVSAARANGCDTFIELSPHPVLVTAIEENGIDPARALGTLRRQEDEWVEILSTLGSVYVLGQPVRWERVYPVERQSVVLPGYPWQHQHLWFELDSEPEHADEQAEESADRHPLLGHYLCSRVDPDQHFWETELSSRLLRRAGAFELGSVSVAPASLWISMAWAAAARLFEKAPVQLADLEVHGSLLVPSGEARSIQLALQAEGGDRASFKVFGFEPGSSEPATLLAGGAVERAPAPDDGKAVASDDSDHDEGLSAEPVGSVLKALQHQAELELAGAEIGARFASCGLFRSERGYCLDGLIDRLWLRPEWAICDLAWSAQDQTGARASGDEQAADPASVPEKVLEACLRLLTATATEMMDRGHYEAGEYLQVSSFERFRVLRTLGQRPRALVNLVENEEGELVGSVRIVDADGLAVELVGARCSAFEADVLQAIESAQVAEWIYDIEWRPSTARIDLKPAELRSSRPDHQEGCWLVFTGGDADGVGPGVAERFRAGGHEVVLVSAGRELVETAPGRLSVDPTDPDQMERLVEMACEADGQQLRGAIYLWGLDEPGSAASSAASLDKAHGRLCAGLLHLSQQLIRQPQSEKRSSDGPVLWIVTAGAQPAGAVGPEAESGVVQAPLWGFGRVIGLEHPEIWGGMIDLDEPASDAAVEQVLGEILSGDGEDQIAYRDGERLLARLAGAGQRITSHEAPRLGREGTYLITGGLGGLGLWTAEWLIACGAGTVVLTSRRAFPERSRWRSGELDAETTDQVEQILRLESGGAQVMPMQADVASREDMVALLDRIAEELPPLRGVVHAAGITRPAPIADMDLGTFDDVLRAKTTGTWLLHQLTRNLELDLFILYSSAASVWGSFGLAPYSAANHFMGIVAHHRRTLGLPALCVDWGRWEQMRLARETGSLADDFLDRLGVARMPTRQAFRSMEALLAGDAVQRTVAIVDWSIFKPVFEAKKERPFLELMQARTEPTAVETASELELLMSLQAADPDRRWDLLVARLQAEAGAVLGVAAGQLLDPQMGFFQMGMDSVMSVELRNRLQLGLGVALPSTLAFENPSIHALATHLAQEVIELEIICPETSSAGESQQEQDHQRLVDEVEQLDEDEAEALLAAELDEVTRGA